ncbi:MAG: peptide-methionine (R)-S-oxide reductase MsrB, partial [Thiobacillaceae bacterium]|nr:peptide-methionine (R)-S-oxide reductase MsrB [Thiobacillaceae bacterium]
GRYEVILAHERLLRAGRSHKRNHAEVVKVSFDPARISLQEVLIAFWENHDPTQRDRQGNDIGSNYRSAIYYRNVAQAAVARATREVYQRALAQAGYGPIVTEIAPLKVYHRAEESHQDYLVKNPKGYCGLGGTGVKYPREQGASDAGSGPRSTLDGRALVYERQLVVFEAPDCPACKRFEAEVLQSWRSPVPVVRTFGALAPAGWVLERPLFATPTMVLFERGREVARYTGYDGDRARFWRWLGYRLLTPEQRRIAFEQGTERPFTGSHLDEKRPGTYVDPITGAPLFRSDGKFDSGTGWPSFFEPVPGALTYHEDLSHGMRRIEVRSASSGIHLGHVFDDGPPPTGKRYCINGNVLRFVPDGARP